MHESRTGDKSAAASMLAVKPSNLNADIGPQWLISEASTYSQAEHKRRERAFFFAGKLLGYVPGVAPFSQLNKVKQRHYGHHVTLMLT